LEFKISVDLKYGCGYLNSTVLDTINMQLSPLCPTAQLQALLVVQQKREEDDVEMGSTVWYNGMPPTSWWDVFKNVVYTDYLMVRRWFHGTCNRCEN
jgi:hypothetical protein